MFSRLSALRAIVAKASGDDAGAGFGFEQEHFFKDGRPLGFSSAAP
jgi:hypothetical protein